MTDATPTFAAADLGAESGRVIVGKLTGERLSLEEVCRFANTPVALPDGLHWNTVSLFEQIRAGLSKAVATNGKLDGVGIDTWGVDYGLLDDRLRLLGIPYHYRDTRTEGMIELADETARTRAALRAHRYADDADQHGLPVARGAGLARASGRRAHRPDPRSARPLADGRRLPTRQRSPPRPGCSTRGPAAGPGTRLRRLGFRPRIFAGDTVEPGTFLGHVHSGLEKLAGLPVWNVAAHDTASAFVAAPVDSPQFGDSLLRDLVTAGRGGRRASARRRCGGFQPDQRARDRRLDPAVAKRHGAMAAYRSAGGTGHSSGSNSITQASNGWRAAPATAIRCSIPIIRSSFARATCHRGSHACARKRASRRRRILASSCARS